MKSWSFSTFKEISYIFPWNWEPRSSTIPGYGFKAYYKHMKANDQLSGCGGEFPQVLGESVYHVGSFYLAVYGLVKLVHTIA